MPWHPKTASTTAPNAAERQPFLDNLVTDLRRVRLSNDPTKWDSAVRILPPSSQLRSRYIGAKSARESPHVGRFFGVTESLVRAISQQNLKSLVKVSGPYLENSRFAEPGGGDQFDLKLCGGFGSPGDATFRRCNLVRF
jgi:hypothetical protein